MSLQLAARHLAAHGRGPDTELVHMGRGEVQALRHLAHASGGALTTNPHTGLPEAGFLSSILPMVAGAVLTPLTGGVINPFTASMLVGGATGLATGSLKKGLMAGLGAYGGAGLASSLGAAGAAGTGALGGAGSASSAGALGGSSGVSLGGGLAATEAPVAEAAASGTPSSMFNLTKSAAAPVYDTGAASQYNLLNGTSRVALGAPAASSATGASAFNAMAPMEQLASVGRGATLGNIGNWAAQNKMAAAGLAAPILSEAMKPPKYKEEPEDSSRGTEYDYDPGTVSPFPESDGTEQRYFSPRYVPRTTPRFAASGGIMHGLSSSQSHLGDYSDGGRLLRGPGDGVSDSIPATIGGKQPARLADGEFVIPARIVSELGNGSTEAGSKQLYAMMDRIQRARRKTTGKNQVATNTKAHKLMPA